MNQENFDTAVRRIINGRDYDESRDEIHAKLIKSGISEQEFYWAWKFLEMR